MVLTYRQLVGNSIKHVVCRSVFTMKNAAIQVRPPAGLVCSTLT
jgi:hypothetical protein